MASESVSPTLAFVAFSAEEMGLVGSAYFVAHLPVQEMLTADGMINLDCVGLGNRLGLFTRRTTDLPFAESLTVTADTIGVNNTAMSDHIPFADAGIPAVFINMSDNPAPSCGPWYHLPTDTVDTLQLDALSRSGGEVVKAVRSAAAAAQPRSASFLFLPLALRQTP